MGRKLLVPIVVAGLIVGCGSSSKSKTSSASTASSSSAGYAATYPPGFSSAFLKSCNSNGQSAACQCALTQIESSVSYSTVQASISTIRSGRPPAWYTNALARCASSRG